VVIGVGKLGDKIVREGDDAPLVVRRLKRDPRPS